MSSINAKKYNGFRIFVKAAARVLFKGIIFRVGTLKKFA